MSEREVMVKIDHVSKQYRLGAIGGTTLREDLARLGARLRKKDDEGHRQGESQLLRLPYRTEVGRTGKLPSFHGQRIYRNRRYSGYNNQVYTGKTVQIGEENVKTSKSHVFQRHRHYGEGDCGRCIPYVGVFE